MEQFPVEYSSLSARALLQLVLERYSLNPASTILFLKRGFNDTYCIDTGKSKYILRVYKHNWRSNKSIRNEIEFLNYLQKNDVGVSAAIIDRNGNYIQTLHAPEGLRYAVLFTYAPGTQMRKLDLQQSYAFGVETGKMHALSKNKIYEEVAFNYGIREQFDWVINTLRPLLANYPEQFKYLQKLKAEFEIAFMNLDESQIAKGICHGDLQAENLHMDKNGKITFFDLDFFGNGYLIYDIGVFIWYDHKNKPKEIVREFLKGYQTQRKLSPLELELIPWFSTLRALFQMTLFCKISDGKQLPLWPTDQVAAFIGKVEKWQNAKGNLF